jgi:hypothetical protein
LEDRSLRICFLRIFAGCSAALAAATLAACGGGGGSAGAITPPATVVTPSPAPTPTPSPYPSADGESFAYKGTYTQQFTEYGTPAPSPSDPAETPQPTATPWTSTSTSNVAQQVTVHANASFNGTTGLTEMETSETDSGKLSTYTVDSKQYLQFASDSTRSSGIDVTQVAVDSSDSNGVKATTTYASGNGILDELPQVPAAQWSDSAARVALENDPSGISITTTYAADGTYAGSTTYPEGPGATVAENADGSGLYTTPFLGAPDSAFSVSPVANGTISIALEAAPLGGTLWDTIPVWYPSVPPVLASDNFVDRGSASIPSTCNVPAAVGTQAVQIDEQRMRLDTIFGEYERTNQRSYVVPPYGAVCVVVHDDLVSYYDFSGQSMYLFNDTPLRETVTDETLGMTGVPATSSKAMAAVRQSMHSTLSTFVAPSTARIHLAIAKRHLQLVRRLRSAFKEAR